VILETTARSDIEEYIRIHQHLGVGDVTCQWGQILGHDNTVALILTFVRPAELVAILEFELKRNHGILVEQILETNALYIQAGRDGDRLKDDLSLPKVVLEVPELGFRRYWDEIHIAHVTAQLRKRGLGRAEAKRKAALVIAEMRKIGATRLGGK
jgi:hypothetical protein